MPTLNPEVNTGTMGEFLNGLANYTEKDNPYHQIKAYPGTEFEEIENILKLLSPLVVFEVDDQNNIKVFISEGNGRDRVRPKEFRFYLNYVILPKINEHATNLECIKGAVETLISFDKNLDEFLQKIKDYLLVTRYVIMYYDMDDMDE